MNIEAFFPKVRGHRVEHTSETAVVPKNCAFVKELVGDQLARFPAYLKPNVVPGVLGLRYLCRIFALRIVITWRSSFSDRYASDGVVEAQDSRGGKLERRR